MPRSLLQQIFRAQENNSLQQPLSPSQPTRAPMSQPRAPSMHSRIQKQMETPIGLGMEFVEEPVTYGARKPQMQSSMVSTDEQNELIHRMSLEIAKMKKQIQELESKSQSHDQRYTEIVGSQKKIYDRVHSALQMFDERLKSVCQDLASRFSVLRGKMTEQKGYETKVEELLERHNSLVNGFETRMDNMSRIVKEQEMQLMTFKSLFQQLSQQRK